MFLWFGQYFTDEWWEEQMKEQFSFSPFDGFPEAPWVNNLRADWGMSVDTKEHVVKEAIRLETIEEVKEALANGYSPRHLEEGHSRFNI